MQRRLQQRRNEYVVLPTEMSPVAQGAKALVAMMGWSKPPASLPSETLLPPRSTIGPTEKEDPRQPSDPIGLRAAVGKGEGGAHVPAHQRGRTMRQNKKARLGHGTFTSK
jgi:hypothetical protein